MKPFVFAFAVLFFAVPVTAAPIEERDTDQNGSRETKIYYDDQGRIEQMTVDKNEDGKHDMTTFYKAGVADRGERDIDFDGIIDTWTEYAPDGYPTLISIDWKRKDQKVDHWIRLENGKVVSKEWDRNFDGKLDYREKYDGSTLLGKEYDDNHDGKFERSVAPPKRGERAFADAYPYDEGGLPKLTK